MSRKSIKLLLALAALATLPFIQGCTEEESPLRSFAWLPGFIPSSTANTGAGGQGGTPMTPTNLPAVQ